MKFSYSLIKRLLPRVPAKHKLAEALNTHSFEVESVTGDTLEIKLPANLYSYAASHIGVAREAALIFKLPFSPPVGGPAKRAVHPPAGKGLVAVEVKEQKLCHRQAARYFDVSKLRSSPEWMKNILISCGMRPIDTVVDITNYIAIETGEPIHAFDADKLDADTRGSKRGSTQKTIIVRRAHRGEKMETLDGKKFALTPDMLVLADPVKALDIAGIKGGAHTGIDRKTKRIVLVASNFDSVNIYKTSRALNLVTDASIRFSHDLSPELVGWGMDRATELLTRAGAKLLDSADWYPKPRGDEIIAFDSEKYEQLIGAPVLVKDAVRIFAGLGFSINADTRGSKRGLTQIHQFLVRVPAWRNDIENTEDLIEEVCRIRGLGKLKPQPPLVSVIPATQEDAVILKSRVRSLLAQFGVDEIYSDSFVGDAEETRDERKHSLFGYESMPVHVANPIADDKKYLRTSLVPLLTRSVRMNARFYDRVRLFEIGNIFGERKGVVSEKLALGVALAAKREEKFIPELKGMANELLGELGIRPTFVEVPNALRIEHDRLVLGYLTLHTFPKQWHGAALELDLQKILLRASAEREFKAIPKYPAVVRDISIILPVAARIGDVVALIESHNPKLIEDVDLIDEYRGRGIEADTQSLTFRIIFQADDRTLSDFEVNQEMVKIGRALAEQLKARVR